MGMTVAMRQAAKVGMALYALAVLAMPLPSLAQETPTQAPAVTSSIERLIGSFDHVDPDLVDKPAAKNLFDLLGRKDRCRLRDTDHYGIACALIVYTPVGDYVELKAPKYYYLPVMALKTATQAEVAFDGRFREMSFEDLAGSIKVALGGGQYARYQPLAVIGNQEDGQRAGACKEGERCNGFAPCTHDQLFDYSPARHRACVKRQ
jgi:hypothetical protein